MPGVEAASAQTRRGSAKWKQTVGPRTQKYQQTARLRLSSLRGPRPFHEYA